MPQAVTASIPNRASRSTAHYFLQGLSEIGIEYLFCNFGTDHAPLIEELARFEADGLRAPKVILCPHDTYVHFIQQPFDQAGLVRPYVKWEYALPSGVTAKEVLRRAHTIMQSEPTGPVYLLLPREVLTQHWDEDAVQSFPRDCFGPTQASGADPEVIEQLAARLVVAKNPILITGYAGRDPAASDAIERLSALAGIRVVDFLTFTKIGRSFPHFGGFQPDHLADVDLGLLVDVDVPWIPIVDKANPATFWAQIDIDVLKSASPMWTFPAHLRIQGKSSRVLGQLCDAIAKAATPDFRVAAAKRIDALTADQKERIRHAAALADKKGQPGEINPHYLCAEIGKAIGPDDIVVNEAVTRQSIPNLQIPRPNAGTMISNAGGGLGASGGTALGVKLALPDRRVVQIVGDGSFYFNNPTAVYAVSRQYALPVFTAVMDNSGWAAVKGATLRVYPEGQAKSQGLFQAGLANGVDFSKIAEAAGCYGERIVDPGDVPAAIARCLGEVRAGRSALLHACVTKL